MLEGILGLLCLGVMAFGVVMLFVLVSGGNAARKDAGVRNDKLARKDEVLDEIFDGQRVIALRIAPDTLPADVTIEGAGVRGYDLTSRTNVEDSSQVTDLVFTLREPAP